MIMIIIYVLRDEHKMICKWNNIILLWFSKVSVLSSPNALFALALSPLGGSFVTLTLFCNTVTGKLLVGMELKNKRKSSCTSASGDERFLIVVSIANIQEAARWQFWKKYMYIGQRGHAFLSYKVRLGKKISRPFFLKSIRDKASPRDLITWVFSSSVPAMPVWSKIKLGFSICLWLGIDVFIRCL